MRRSADLSRILPVAHDLFMAVAALFVALLLRYGIDAMPPRQVVLVALATFGVFAAVSFRIVGLGRGIWRFTSVSDLRAIVLAATITVAGFLLAMFLVNRLGFIPRSVPIIAWFVLIVLLGAPRILYRIVIDSGVGGVVRAVTGQRRGKNGSLLIVGSTADADRVARALGLDRGNRDVGAAGIVDLDGRSAGLSIRGVPILGSVLQLEQIIERLDRKGTRPSALVVAAPRENQSALRAVVAVAAKAKLPIKRLVGSDGLLEQGSPANLQPVTLEDLLGRPPVSLDLARIRDLVAGHVAVITGAGGSIGSEIARQVAAFAPRRLVLIDNSEFNLYRIDAEVAALAPSLDRLAVIASVRDRERIERLFRDERPAVVFHAAALKHVPLVEANPCEGVLTNVGGTRHVADAAVAAGARAMVVISTDKAIRPSSVMGASKRVAESYCQALDVNGSPTRFITVRFGNVLGSTGSVVPLFEEQIRRGGPVTVTHPDMRRYFMTITEATELVLQAAAHGLAHPEEVGCIHVLDMGEPIRIMDLARTMIALAGLRPDEDVPIAVIGIRPGEKLHEEYFDREEPTSASATPGVLVASPRLIERPRLVALLDSLCAEAESGDAAHVRSLLTALVPDLPLEDGVRSPLAEDGPPVAEMAHAR